MRSRRWKRAACAACLWLTVVGAYKASAVPLRGETRPALASETVVYGRRLLTFSGYELNVSFTPAGRVVCLNIARG